MRLSVLGKAVTFFLGFAGKTCMNSQQICGASSFIFFGDQRITVRKIVKRSNLDYDRRCSLTRISAYRTLYVGGRPWSNSLVFVGKYGCPDSAHVDIVRFMVYYTIPWVSSRIFRDSRFERMLLLYGFNGNDYGLALLRSWTPNSKQR